jgi:hypothetical protein
VERADLLKAAAAFLAAALPGRLPILTSLRCLRCFNYDAPDAGAAVLNLSRTLGRDLTEQLCPEIWSNSMARLILHLLPCCLTALLPYVLNALLPALCLNCLLNLRASDLVNEKRVPFLAASGKSKNFKHHDPW